MNRTLRAGLVVAVVSCGVFAYSYRPVAEPVIPRALPPMEFESSWSQEWDSRPWVGHSWFEPWTTYQSDPPMTSNPPVYTEPAPLPPVPQVPRPPDITWVPSAPVDRRPALEPPQPPAAPAPPMSLPTPWGPPPTQSRPPPPTQSPAPPPTQSPAPPPARVYEHAALGADG